MFNRFIKDRFAGNHHAQVDDFVVIALQDDANNVFADVMHVTFDGGDQEHAAFGCAFQPGRFFLLFHEWFKVGDCFLHHACGFDNLRQKHFAFAEQITDDGHTVHQRSFDHLQTTIKTLASFFGVFDDVFVDAFDQRVLHPIGNGSFAPG